VPSQTHDNWKFAIRPLKYSYGACVNDEFRLKAYKHPRLKFVVRSKINGK
jgi:hypothetical protein